jgi:ketosteroid isomerase-like protein
VKRTLLFCLLVFAVVCSSMQLPAQARRAKRPAASAPAAGSADMALIELEKQFFAAIREKDSDKLNGILADNFAYVVPGQPEMTRAQFLKYVHGLADTIEWLGADDMHVRIFGDIAVVTGVRNMKTRMENGSLVSADTGFADVFRKNGDEWELVLVHALEMTAPASSQVGK